MSALVWTLPHPPRGRKLGAAELKAASRQFLTRALLIAACAHLMSVAGARVLSAWLARPAHVVDVDVRDYEVITQGIRPAPPVAEGHPGSRTNGENGRVVPVGETEAPADKTLTLPGSGDVAGVDIPGSGRAIDDTVIIPSTEIPPGDFPYPFEEPPRLLGMPRPEYPSMARDLGIEGTVEVEALVGTDGRVLSAQVRRSVRWLDEAALAAVRASRWQPARNNERAVAVLVSVPIRFRLSDR